MSLNYKEIDLILTELDAEGSFLQEIVQPSYDTIAFYIYRSGTAKTVLVCLAPGACRIHETRRRVPKNSKPLRFMEFLRSRVRGARIQECRQLNEDRIVYLHLVKSGEEFNMYIRLWSGAANIIVTDMRNTILDVFFRRPKRGEISLGTYTPPEPKKGEGAPAPVREIRSFDETSASPAPSGSAENAAASSGSPAAEAVHTDTSVNGNPDVSGSSISFNQKVDRWYGEHAAALSREALLALAEKQYFSRKSRMETALEKLETKREEFLHAGHWKHRGDLILANLWKIEKKASFVECEDYETGAVLRLALNPDKNGQENAQEYYDTYKKAVSGLADLEDDIRASRSALETLSSDFENLKREQNPLLIHKMLRRQNTPKQQLEKKYPGLAFSVDGWLLLVGRTAAENDELLRRHVKGRDMWFHTRDWSGGYVFVKNRAGKTIPLELMKDAGNLALFYSKGRKAAKGDLYYTEVKYLRRAKNAPKGTVLPSREKNLYIELDGARLRRLETCKQ